MTPFKNYEPTGVLPAVLLPFTNDLAIDEPEYRRHLRDVCATPGLSSIVVNGHASEVSSCTFEEQRRVLEITMSEVGDRIPVTAGVYADGTMEAVRLARMSAEAGASAMLIFPPNVFTLGKRPEMQVAHVSAIASATDLPLILFQFPAPTQQNYSLPFMVDLAARIPSFRAIKDACGNVQLHERHVRVLQSLSSPVHVLTTHSPWLMSSLALGCNGLLSGSGSVIPELQVALWQAMQAKDIAKAQAINDRIYPTSEVFYADPWTDMHNRMKEALVLLGRQDRAVVRPPLVPLSRDEVGRIRKALVDAGLLGKFAAEAAE